MIRFNGRNQMLGSVIFQGRMALFTGRDQQFASDDRPTFAPSHPIGFKRPILSASSSPAVHLLPIKIEMLPNTFLVISLFILFMSGVCVSVCSSGWTHLASGQKCVKAFPAPTDWSNGELMCAYQGAHHISVKDFNENYFLAELARKLPGQQVWLGAFRAGTPYYSWSDRTPFGYFVRWRGNVPPLRNGLGCVKLDGVSGEWVQSCCRKSAATICQKQAASRGTLRLR